MATTTEEILDAIGSMTVLELSELLSAFEEKFGVTAAAPVAVAAVAAVVEPLQVHDQVLRQRVQRHRLVRQLVAPAH